MPRAGRGEPTTPATPAPSSRWSAVVESSPRWSRSPSPAGARWPPAGPSRYYGGDEALAARAGDHRGRGAAAARAGPARSRRRGGRRAASPPPWPPGRPPCRRVGRRPGGRWCRGARRRLPGPVPGRPAARRPRAGRPAPRLGLRTLGALAALPAADVVARFGPAGRLAHRRASGLDDRPLDARPPPPDLAVHLELDPPVTDLGPVAFAGKHLADELHERLAAAGPGLHPAGGGGRDRARRAPRAAVAPRARLHRRRPHRAGALAARRGGPESARAPADGRHRAAAAGARRGGARRRAPAGVLGRAHPGRRAGGRAAARLMGLLGPDAVTVPEWRGGRDPADAGGAGAGGRRRPAAARPCGWRRLPASRPGRAAAGAVAGQRAGRPVRRPRWSTPTAAPVAVDGRGLVSAAPARLAVAGAPGRAVVAWAGPWPADERWWDPAGHRRRARFQLVTDDGAAHLAVLEAGAGGGVDQATRMTGACDWAAPGLLGLPGMGGLGRLPLRRDVPVGVPGVGVDPGRARPSRASTSTGGSSASRRSTASRARSTRGSGRGPTAGR